MTADLAKEKWHLVFFFFCLIGGRKKGVFGRPESRFEAELQADIKTPGSIYAFVNEK